MSERIKCPNCGTGLILSETAGEWRATCPRCLAEISAPEVRREPDAIQAERPERRKEPLPSQERGRNGRPDVDVRRDTKRTSVALIVLAVISGLGTVIMSRERWGYFGDQYQSMLWTGVCLLFLAGLITLIYFFYERSRANLGLDVERGEATCAMAGGMILLGALAGLVYFLATCHPGPMR